jgi:Ca2+/Na+ antiporter
MIQEYNRKSFYFGIPGIILQLSGRIMANEIPKNENLGAVYIFVGTVLLLVGLLYYAKAKGRHPAWCLMAFLSFIGLIVLACLKDKSEVKNKYEDMPAES